MFNIFGGNPFFLYIIFFVINFVIQLVSGNLNGVFGGTTTTA
ncbi:MAG TPA: hypothetical protein VMV94_05380 [Phycisphaerae bacterium]|nr:hypothetical protein [Phycisphaerae bacterium]